MHARRSVRLLNGIQVALMVALAMWTLVGHTILVNVTGYSAWRLGGFGMYGEPGSRYVAIAVVRCSDAASCDFAARSASSLRTRVVPGTLSVFDALTERNTLKWAADMQFASSAQGERAKNRDSYIDMVTFPNAKHARQLLQRLPEAACPEHCVVGHYRQRVSLLSRKVAVDTRVFVP